MLYWIQNPFLWPMSKSELVVVKHNHKAWSSMNTAHVCLNTFSEGLRHHLWITGIIDYLLPRSLTENLNILLEMRCIINTIKPADNMWDMRLTLKTPLDSTILFYRMLMMLFWGLETLKQTAQTAMCCRQKKKNLNPDWVNLKSSFEMINYHYT